MAIAPISVGDTNARAKMNEAIAKANLVDGKASATALTAGLASEAAARQAAIASEAAAREADLRSLPLPMPVQRRPGDAPLEFGRSLADGEASGITPVPASMLRYDEAGKVVRVTGDDIVAPRHLYALEPGRRYLATFAVQRRVNSPDPDNDAIRCAFAWYGQGKGRLLATPQTVAQDLLGLTTGSGRQVVRAVVSRAAGADVDIVAPAGARYVRPYVQTFGTLVQNDVEVIDWADVTDVVAFAPDVSALEGRVAAVEGLALGDRVLDLESQVIAPNEFRVATIGDLEAANVPLSADTVLVLGYYAPGDGGGHRRVFTAIGDGGIDDRQSLDGRWWTVSEISASAKQVGAVGGGAADDASFINKLLARAAALGGGDAILSRGTYLIGSSVVVPSGVRFKAERGAKIKIADGANIHAVKFADNATDAEIIGLEIDGNKANQTTGGHGISSGGVLAKGLRVESCIIYDCKLDGIGLAATETDGAIISRNMVRDCSAAGITNRVGTLRNSTISVNVVQRTGTHNIGITSVCDNVTITANACEDAGLATPGADNITGYNPANKNLTVTANVCKNSGNHNIHVSGEKNIVVSSNVGTGATQTGVSMLLSSGTVTGSVVSNNVIEGSGNHAYWFRGCVGAAVNSNVAKTPGGHCYLVENCEKLAISGNVGDGSVAGAGIRGLGTNANHSITGNVLTGNLANGISLTDAEGCIIVANKCTGNTGLGINLGGAEANNLAADNDVTGNTNSVGVAVASSTTVVRNNKNSGSTSLASAATITIPAHTDIVALTGSTAVTSITAGFRGRQITIRSSGYTGTITDGSNLIMAGNAALANNSNIRFESDGANWHEISRSVN